MSGDPAARGRFHGAIQIVRFNWPWYLAAIVVTVVAVVKSGAVFAALATVATPLSRALALAAVLAALTADFWLLASLVVSHVVYDRSALATGEWMTASLSGEPRSIGVFHAGLDETSPHVSRLFPAARVQVFDFHDDTAMSEASIERARRIAGNRASTPIRFASIPLEAGALDAALVVFAAHELRKGNDRATFFLELARVLRPEGDLVVVEHLRDVWNFLAFGPGAFHFFARDRWLSAFKDAGLTVDREARITPFVAQFSLRKGPREAVR